MAVGKTNSTAPYPYIEYGYVYNNTGTSQLYPLWAKIHSDKTLIWGYAFYEQGLLYYDFSGMPNLTTIGVRAFYSNNALHYVTELPETLTGISDYAFYENFLPITKLPASITILGSRAFGKCSGIVNLEIPCVLHLNMTTANGIFYNCSNLEKVWLRSSCSVIDAVSAVQAPFINCSADLVLYVEEDTAPSGWGAYWNHCSASETLTVVYGQTTCPW